MNPRFAIFAFVVSACFAFIGHANMYNDWAKGNAINLSSSANGTECDESSCVQSGILSTSYGNATFIIADENDANAQIKVFRAKGYNNEMITDEAFIKEGDKVVVIGKLQKYVKNDVVTPEVSSCYIKSIETATGIQNVKISKANGAIYNLAGQQVEKATKGIYISTLLKNHYAPCGSNSPQGVFFSEKSTIILSVRKIFVFLSVK